MTTTPLRRLALVALALAAAACSDQAPTAAPAAAVTPSAALSAAEQTALDAELAAERARVGDAAKLESVLYQTLTPVWKTASPITGLLGLPLLACEPLPYAADVQIVGSAGGVLRAGPHTLTIPSGALSKPTVITAEAKVGLVRSVRFSPHGLQFQRATKLEMSYDGCRKGLLDRPAIVYVDGQLNILEWLSSTVLSGERLRGDVWHFSDYAVGRRSSYATSW